MASRMQDFNLCLIFFISKINYIKINVQIYLIKKTREREVVGPRAGFFEPIGEMEMKPHIVLLIEG